MMPESTTAEMDTIPGEQKIPYIHIFLRSVLSKFAHQSDETYSGANV